MTSSASASDLCVSCNLCCDGSVFTSARIKDEDKEDPRLFDMLDIKPRSDGALAFRQPCGQLRADGSCGCYDIRPSTCKRFKCKLLRRLEVGTVDVPMAQEVIAHIKAMRDRVMALLVDAMEVAPDTPHAATLTEWYNDLAIRLRDTNRRFSRYKINRALLLLQAYDAQIDFHICPGKPRAKLLTKPSAKPAPPADASPEAG